MDEEPDEFANPTSLDTTFGPGGTVLTDFGGSDTRANAVAIQAGGKIVAAGQNQATPGSNSDFALTRYTESGSLDMTFGSGGKLLTGFRSSSADLADAVAIEPDGKVIAAGFSGADGSWKFALVRYTESGRLDTSFGSGGKVLTGFRSSHQSSINAVAIQPDRKIVAVGESYSDTSVRLVFAVVRYLGH